MLILGSASPRRHELLVAAGIDHVVRPVTVSEVRYPGERAADFVQSVAEEKARAVISGPTDIVLGADTIVCIQGYSEGQIDDQVFGKPGSDEDAARMLRCLSGRDHWVYTGICILAGARRIVDIASTRVSFLQLTNEEIQEYTRSGEPRDKAGAYAIQGLASKFVSSIEGCYHNVVGLPVSLVYRHLKTL
ncbi:MAG: Maf family protein [Bryobacteraceae bacterium]